MRKTGNKTQWINGYPQKELLLDDVKNEQLFVLQTGNKIVGAFVFFIGIEPTYAVIENGKWQKEGEYGVLHRVASDGSCRGVFTSIFKFALSQIKHIRIDTHADNKVMQSVLEKHGFTACGTVYMQDCSPRIAYEYFE
jgi:hypothetical protein